MSARRSPSPRSTESAPTTLAEAALCAAMCELVAVHGEDCAALIAARLAERVAAGEFSDLRRH